MEQNSLKMAAIIACYNRATYTKRCIEELVKMSKSIPSISLKIYIWDDASTDETVDILKDLSENVVLLRGPGKYYWSKSMYYALKEAVKAQYDLYLMVNDDVDFYDDGLEIMLNSYLISGGKCGIVGSTEHNDKFTYGGRDKQQNIIFPNKELCECYYANWNCFLVDKDVISIVGLICPKYPHAGGDYDYSCRMRRKGIKQYVATDYIGICEIDHYLEPYFNPDLSVKERIQALLSPKGQPIRMYFRLNWVDKRFKGIVIAIYSYLLLLTKVIFVKHNKVYTRREK